MDPQCFFDEKYYLLLGKCQAEDRFLLLNSWDICNCYKEPKKKTLCFCIGWMLFQALRDRARCGNGMSFFDRSTRWNVKYACHFSILFAYDPVNGKSGWHIVFHFY